MKDVPFNYSNLQVFYGYFKDDSLLTKSSSGGAATYFSQLILAKGGCVYGVRYTPDFRDAVYTCVDSVDELNLLKGSKYIQAKKTITEITENGERTIPVWKHVEEQLLEKRLVLFIGLGCDVGALKNYLMRRQVEFDKLLYTIDLICHGATYTEVQSQYVSNLCEKFGSPVKNLNLRNKKKGWTPSFVRAEFENGQVLEEKFSKSDYGRAFYIMSKKSCYSCRFRGSDHMSDITVGDYWGLSNNMKEYNKNGVSLIITNTEHGKELINYY